MYDKCESYVRMFAHRRKRGKEISDSLPHPRVRKNVEKSSTRVGQKYRVGQTKARPPQDETKSVKT